MQILKLLPYFVLNKFIKTETMKTTNFKNQEITEKFTDQNIFLDVSDLIEEILMFGDQGESEIMQTGDIENLYVYPEFQSKYISFYGGTAEDYDKELTTLYKYYDEGLNPDGREWDGEPDEVEEWREEFLEEIELFELHDQELQEIASWWAVSEPLYIQLLERGEPVLSDGYRYYWGRCQGGQALHMDSVIEQICSDLEILEGQKYAW